MGGRGGKTSERSLHTKTFVTVARFLVRGRSLVVGGRPSGGGHRAKTNKNEEGARRRLFVPATGSARSPHSQSGRCSEGSSGFSFRNISTGLFYTGRKDAMFFGKKKFLLLSVFLSRLSLARSLALFKL